MSELEPIIGTKPACTLIGRARATHYRAHCHRPGALDRGAARHRTR